MRKVLLSAVVVAAFVASAYVFDFFGASPWFIVPVLPGAALVGAYANYADVDVMDAHGDLVTGATVAMIVGSITFWFVVSLAATHLLSRRR